MIEIENVWMKYDRDPVVRDISLIIPDSGITALIGANGAGKSTLLAGVGRLHELESGTVRIDGRELDEWKNAELARTIAVLRQENHLAVRLTVAELVMLGRHPHTGGRVRTEDHMYVARALKSVSIDEMADRFVDELSGGQRQRAFIAMALAQDTKYLLLDEPLSSLDMAQGRSMMRYLRGAMAERDLSIVVVIHDVNTAAAYADRIVAMKDGAIVAAGTPAEVMRAEILRDVFDVDVEVAEIGGRLVGMPVV